MSATISIAGRQIGRSHQPFIIAEMSGNHNQSLERALAIVDAAAKAGAHALKIQTYTADTMTLDLEPGEFFIDDPNSLWTGRSLHELYQEAHTPWEWHAPIFERAARAGMIPFSTPFDATAVDFLEEARRALLQDRLVREHRPAADPQGRGDRQADDHLDRHGDGRRASTKRCARRARPAAAISCCSSAPAPIRRCPRTPTS